MSIIDFYTKVIHSLKLIVSQDHFVQAKVGDVNKTITISGKPLVLPTKAHIDTALDTDENGTVSVSKVLYNPLNEDTIKGDSLSLKQTKDTVERRLSYTFAGLGEMLLTLAEDPSLQKKTPMDINNFLMSLSGSSKEAKQQVDKKSITLWSKIYQKSLEIDPSKSYLKSYLKRVTKVNGVKYNRMMVISFPFYDELLTADRDTTFFGVGLRKKDIEVFKRIHEFLIDDMDNNATITFGSEDNESPGFIAVMSAYIKLGNKFNRIAGKLKFVDEETYDYIKIPNKIGLKELDNLAIYKNEVLALPNDIDMNRKKASLLRANTDTVNNSIVNSNYTLPHPTQPQQQSYTQQPMAVAQPPELTGVSKILAAGNVPIAPVVNPLQQQMQQPGYPQHPQPMYPQQQQPMGINTLMQQQRPMYQQPYQSLQQPMGYNTSGGYQQQMPLPTWR